MKIAAFLMISAATLLTLPQGGRAAEPMVLSDGSMDQVTAGVTVSKPQTGISPLPEVHFTIVIPLVVTINSNTVAVSHSNSAANVMSTPAAMDSMSWLVPYTWDVRSGLQFGTLMGDR